MSVGARFPHLLILVAAALTLRLAGGAVAATPSFNCATAKAPIEKLICGSVDLANADAAMAQAFAANLASRPDTKQATIEVQRQWLKDRLVSCPILPDQRDGIDRADAAGLCLLTLYKQRIEELRDPEKAGVSRTAEDKAACNGLAERMRAFSQPVKSPLDSLIGDMGEAGDPFIKLDLSQQEQMELAKRVRPRLPENPQLDFVWDNDGLASDPSGVAYEWGTLGASSIVAANIIEGTGNCQYFALFDMSGSGLAKSVPPPEDEEGGIYCWEGSRGGRGMVGEVGGRPSFVGVDFGDGLESYRLFVRSHDRWLKSCRIRATWEPAFVLSDNHCDGSFCAALPNRVLDIVRAFDMTGDLSEFWAKVELLPTPDMHKKRLDAFKAQIAQPRPWISDGDRALANAMGEYRTIELGGTVTTLANFNNGRYLAVSGSSPDTLTVADFGTTEIGSQQGPLVDIYVPKVARSYGGFSYDSAFAPVTLDGKTYLLRVGHGHFTYRTDNDYLFGLYANNNGKIEPVAGFFIDKTHGPKATVTVLDLSTP